MSRIDALLRNKLTDEQYAAAVDPAREVLTLACAGSGKSRTLAYRIAWLMATGEPPDAIVAFTFTDKAADTIKRRVAEALSRAAIEPTILGKIYIGTIHSYCQFVLARMDVSYHQFDVLDDNRLKLYLISRFGKLGLHSLRSRARAGSYFDTIKQVSDAWKTIHDELIDIREVSVHDPQLGTVLQALQDSLQRDQFMDFSLMIREVVDALRRGECRAREVVSALRHLMVDEYQDVNPCQQELIRRLHGVSDTLFVVGDDDQSIYGWRGADVNNILNFTERYPDSSSHTLARNFRSTRPIVAAADAFVDDELGPSRIQKDPSAEYNQSPRDFRILWFPSRAEEARWVARRIKRLLGTTYREHDGSKRGLTPGDFAILMRSTRSKERDGSARHAAFTQALDSAGIKYTLEAGGGPFERPHAAVLRDTFELLRHRSPTRDAVRDHFQSRVVPVYPKADFDALVRVLTDWGRRIHGPTVAARRRVYPQQLVHDVLEALGLGRSNFGAEVMRDIGLFSRMIQDVETVYVSVDSKGRFAEILNFLGNAAEAGYDVSTDDVLIRPDAVMVATVHKAKGLEFPVVFVVDAEQGRFPGARRGYNGWLPHPVIRKALDRGAYGSTIDEEVRLFYTAITRAERYLCITGSQVLPAGKQQRQPSSFSARLADPEISVARTTLPKGLTRCPPRQRIDDAAIPTTFSEIRYYLNCPRNYQLRQTFGFSPPIPDMLGFGITVHTAVEKLHEKFTNRAPTESQADATARAVFHLKHVPPSNDPVNNPGPYERAQDSAADIARRYASSYGDDFARWREVEARFEVPVKGAVISGAIDLLLKEDDRGAIVEAEVIDFKALGEGDETAENSSIDWIEFCLQVQLYAKAARDVLGENARTGSVHLLRDNRRVRVPITARAINAAIQNVEWAVARTLEDDFPMRPDPAKCDLCDFRALCAKSPQHFRRSAGKPPPVHLPRGLRPQRVRAFSMFRPYP